MRHHEHPSIGSWYKDQEYNAVFEVVASDDNDYFVEIQYFAGEIEEIDIETWYELDLKPIPAPEDWSGPFEMAREDLGYTDESFHPDEWDNPINEIEPSDNLES